MKRFFSVVLAVLMAVSLCIGGALAASGEPAAPAASAESAVRGDVCILYTNDVHCAVDKGVGYQGLAALKNSLLAQGDEVLVVDAGDAIQGDTVGTLSQGEYIIDIMNALPYDAAVPGNHEFDYGVEQFLALTEKAAFPYLAANFYDADGELLFEPYEIFERGGVKIALVGVCTPQTLSTSNPLHFVNEAGESVYAFAQDKTGEALYAAVQAAVDGALAEGADYVVALTHLGINAAASPWTVSDLITHTHGIDVALDAHSHSVIEGERVKNLDGKTVLLSSTGTNFENVGCLRIAADGTLSTSLISDGGIASVISDVRSRLEERTNEVVAHSDVPLYTKDPATGERMIRSNETNLGDLVADAYRKSSGADIAIINGGGIRSDIQSGDITYGDVIAVHPFGNSLCMDEATGQEILDALELSAAQLPGEFGGFLQVSGLSFTVDLGVESSVVTDENSAFVSADGPRRVKDVLVGGEPIDPGKTYTVASHNFLLKSGGDGYSMFADNTVLLDEFKLDNQVLIDFIKDDLGGTVGEQYADPYGEGRITILEAK